MPPLTRPAQWRSLDQLADTPGFRRWIEREFPAVTDLCTGPERRSFLKLMAASLALAGLSGCDDPPDGRAQEVPYVRNPERMEPSAALSYASVALLDGVANGILVTTRNGRPLKIEGNPDHPWSRGGTDVFGQASILDLYDPARSQTVRFKGEASNWHAFHDATLDTMAALRKGSGGQLRLLTGPVSSPSLRAQVAATLRAFPGSHWHTYAAAGQDTAYEGTQQAFGRPLQVRWRFDHAKVLVALDADFLDGGAHQVGVSRDWVTARQAAAASGELLPLHAAASIPNLTSAKADYPLVATPAELMALAQGLLDDVSGAGAPAAGPAAAWRAAASAALLANRGASLVLAGSMAPPELQALVHRLNAALGNAGQTVFYTDPVAEPAETLTSLADAMRAGSVAMLIMLDANPVYDAPGGLGFADALSRVRLKVHAGPFEDETGLRCDWHLPLSHPLEAWGDARSLDGTVGFMQPTVAPLYEGRTAAEILSLLGDSAPKSGQDLLRRHWQGAQDAAEFEPKWQAMLLAGFVAGSAFPAQAVSLTPAPPPGAAAAPAGLDVVFRPDPTVWDGRGGNNGWLQELPKPLTKITWENAVTVGPVLAAREGLSTGDKVSVSAGGRVLTGPAWVLPGQADGVVGLTLGYGRSAPELISAGLGYDANALRDSAGSWRIGGASLRKLGGAIGFATTQDHNTMEGHDFVRVQQVGGPVVGESASWSQATIYGSPQHGGTGVAWGMVIDLDACIGCNACVTACQAENNIAVVGREQVALGREMHWLRVDRYYEGPPEAPQTRFQPVPCMHCEDAPCEVGCPVEATLHDSEGLNLMVYNRCIGTRACSGYCPYKVRHFNYLDYSAGAAPTLQLQRNPQVTVRARGVMEKCTYCVQRIEGARIEADKRDGAIPDGAVQTACQGACPTRAISFGDLNAKGSAVAAARADDRNYALLGELNVRPRTSYLAVRAPRDGQG